ncbi:MAG TPA: outer membrane beta-barrel protein [Caulobacteraceae bacterium]|jgi:hypothetical protein
MKLLLAAAAGAAMLTAAGAASAQNLPGVLLPATPYFNLGISGAELESTEDLEVFGFTGRAGVRMGRNVALEAEYTQGIDEELERQYAAYLVGLAPISDNGDIFLRVGLGRVDIDTPIQGGNGDGFDTVNYGAGFQVFASSARRIGIRADYTRLDNQESSNSSAPSRDANMFTVSVVWRLQP